MRRMATHCKLLQLHIHSVLEKQIVSKHALIVSSHPDEDEDPPRVATLGTAPSLQRGQEVRSVVLHFISIFICKKTENQPITPTTTHVHANPQNGFSLPL